MADQLLLTTGTAKAKFLARNADGPTDPLYPLFSHLQLAVKQYNVEGPFVALAWEIVQLDKSLSAEDRLMLFLLCLCLLIAEQQGNTRIPIDHGTYLADMLQMLLNGSEMEAKASELTGGIGQLLQSGRANTLVGLPGEYKPLLYDPPYVATHKLWTLEQQFIRRITHFCQDLEVDQQQSEKSLAAVTGKKSFHGIVLNRRQIDAVKRAATAALLIISGGPGTGKTTVVISILRMLVRMGVDVASIGLAAPTGKAANRLDESIHNGFVRAATMSDEDWKLKEHLPGAQTLHRLLGYSPNDGTFRHHEHNRLSQTVLIVDEGSMVDLFMMERLVRSLRDDARLILLGDAEQLPSVEAGAILRDLTRAAANKGSSLHRHVVRLEESMRMDPSDPNGRHILLVANKINDGQVPNFKMPGIAEPEYAVVFRENVKDIAFAGVEFLDAQRDKEPAARQRSLLLDLWFERFIGCEDFQTWVQEPFTYGQTGFSSEEVARLNQIFAHLNQFKILCFTRTYRSGAQATNEDLHHRLLRSRKEADTAFAVGEAVLMTQNDYQRMIFNGDQGVVLKIEYEGREQLMAVFPRGPAYTPFHLQGLRGQITLSYAMTVHKSQGSEFDHALILLPDKDLPINSRELLYTAVTRCKRSATISGKREIFEQGIARKIDRFTGISDTGMHAV